MAAGLMRKIAGDTVTVDSAGTQPGTTINALLRAIPARNRRRHRQQHPKQLTDDLVRAADRSLSSATTPAFKPPATHQSKSGTRTNPPTAASTASNACA